MGFIYIVLYFGVTFHCMDTVETFFSILVLLEIWVPSSLGILQIL
jgi:hypothetical protein